MNTNEAPQSEKSTVSACLTSVFGSIKRFWNSGTTGKVVCIGVALMLIVIGAITDDEDSSPRERGRMYAENKVEEQARSGAYQEQCNDQYSNYDKPAKSYEDDGAKDKKKSNPILGMILIAVGAFALFQFKNAIGRGRLNDILTSFGHGSFMVAILSSLGRLFWGIIALICLFGGLGML